MVTCWMSLMRVCIVFQDCFGCAAAAVLPWFPSLIYKHMDMFCLKLVHFLLIISQGLKCQLQLL